MKKEFWAFGAKPSGRSYCWTACTYLHLNYRIETELGRRLMAGGGALHVVGKLKVDDWNGRDGAELEIEDAADPRRV